MKKKGERLILSICAFLLAFGMAVNSSTASPVGDLERQEPALYKLYRDSKTYAVALSNYAAQQGFQQPYEKLGTTVHEMIHINSAIHAGFFIDGTYYEPYLRGDAWPALTNQDIKPYLLSDELSLISAVYMPNTPRNTIGNILDEINAYSHVAKFICRNEPQSRGKQMRNLSGHLSLLKAYLRISRTFLPGEYAKLAGSRESGGAIETLYARAVRAMQFCGEAVDRAPAIEIENFLKIYRDKQR